jgi:hypothetical protein
VITACAISLPFVRARDRFGRPLPRDGLAFAQPGDGPRRPLEYLLELCSGTFAWPAAALFSDQGTGVDGSVGRETALTDVEFPPARGGGRLARTSPASTTSGVSAVDSASVITAIPR